MNLSAPLIAAFVSRHFNARAVSSALGAAADAAESSDDEVTAAWPIGAALRAESVERAQAAAMLWAKEVVDWKAAIAKHRDAPRKAARQLGAICAPEPTPGRRTLLRAGWSDLIRLAALFESSLDGELGANLIAWVEFGDEAARKRLGASTARPELSIDAVGEIGDRIFAVLSPDADSDRRLRWLAGVTGRYGQVALGAHAVARTLGVAEVSPGLTCSRGGRATLHTDEIKPLVDVIARGRPELMIELLPVILDNSCLAGGDYELDMLENVPWDEVVDIRIGDASFGGRRLGPLIVSTITTGKKPGALRCKVAANAKIAIKDLAKTVAAAEVKLGARSGTVKLAGNLDQLLYAAAMQCNQSRTRLLLELGGKPDGHVADDGRTALIASWGDDPEIVRMYADAGAEIDRPAAEWSLLDLLADADRIAMPRLGSALMLIERGARGHAIHGAMPIYHAAARGHAELVEALVAAGADGTTPPKTGAYAGKTALELATAAGAYATMAALAPESLARSERA